jgi:hypothetical protein
MKKTIFFPLVIFVVLAFVTAPTVSAGRKKKATPPPVRETVISSITPNAITITEDKTTKTVAITQFTEIALNGRKATVADLKPGMLVSLTLADPSRASRISATEKK